MKFLVNFIRRLNRKKNYLQDLSKTDQLSRCLSVFDLTALGIGSTVGLGMYILAGQVAATKTGPAIILSFLIAAVASLFAGLCYAEFGARVPKAGSAYVYGYVSVGEFVAFIIGWTMILEHVIGAASVARGYSGYISGMFDDKIIQVFNSTMHMNIPHLSQYPDFLAFSIVILVSILLTIGVKESSRFNIIFTSINLLVAAFVIIAGSVNADIANWNINPSKIPLAYKAVAGNGGFMPFGFAGVISGAGSCFYAFIGFDIIATTGEEAKNPARSTPIAIILALVISFFAYFGVSLVQTMMAPYYLQNNEHPLSYIFEYVDWPAAKWFITIGAISGLTASLLGTVFALPRIVYSMANDGLIFKWLGKVHHYFKTPMIATLLGGFMGGFMAMMFDVEALTSMMSIGTLLAYTMVAVSVLIIRYRLEEPDEYNKIEGDKTNSFFQPISLCNYDTLLCLINYEKIILPSPSSSRISKFLIGIISLLSVVLAVLLLSLSSVAAWWNITLTIITLTIIALCVLFLWLQPCQKRDDIFMVPCMPLLPVVSILINVFLMASLDVQTWLRFAIWMAFGFAMYFGYGIRHSTEGNRLDEYSGLDDDEEQETLYVSNRVDDDIKLTKD